jgi:hypothetical protein
MEGKELAGHGLYTRDIAAAAAMIAIGCKLRDEMAVTATKTGEGPAGDVIFWFQEQEVQCPLPAGEIKAASWWLAQLLCPWSDFKLSLEHPVAYMKAAAENRKNLLGAVKSALENPFRVIQRGRRIAVLGPAVTEANARRLLNQG